MYLLYCQGYIYLFDGWWTEKEALYK